MITVKRFWTFQYDTYYPLGGMYDFKAGFDTPEAAIQTLKDADCILAHNEVWDIQEMKLIWKNGVNV